MSGSSSDRIEWGWLLVGLLLFAGLVFVGARVISRLGWEKEDVTPPGATPTIQPGDCYPIHALPPADEVAVTIFGAMGYPPESVSWARWQVRAPGNDLWLKIEFTDADGLGILFIDLVCGFWPAPEPYGTMALRWGEFYIERLATL